MERFFSSEFQLSTAPVTRLYIAFFQRIPDTAGLLFWADRFRRGTPLETVSQNFASSFEFQQRYGSLEDAEFVTLVYDNVLGREPDPDGLSFWTSRLELGLSRGRLMTAFSESSEFRSRSGVQVFVTQIYLGMLGRAPDQLGFDFWVAVLGSGTPGLQLIQTFLETPEYHLRFLPES